MRRIWNLFAFIGLAVIVAAGYFAPDGFRLAKRLVEFDPRAFSTYLAMAGHVLETGNASEAIVWKSRVADGVGEAELDQGIRAVLARHDITVPAPKSAGEPAAPPVAQEPVAPTPDAAPPATVPALPPAQAPAMAPDAPSRAVTSYPVCVASTEAKLAEYSDAYTAHLACRLLVLRDDQGKMWLYTVNLDPMIYGGLPMPPALKARSEDVKAIILEIMKVGRQTPTHARLGMPEPMRGSS